MGQAWCKEKSTKAQDSKSPLDRVFLRCAHRIYPGLKEEGSVLGGATQRVTSSEIGYASSPPRELLTRGQSIDSVDRPFHPSDWVDVNLEVPGTPRVSGTMTNLTLDTTLYSSTTPASTNSGGSNNREFAPVPPPRRRKKNRGRPLPPKPDQASGNQVDRVAIPKRSFRESRDSSHEPLYSSVKSRDPSRLNKIEIYEHKVNGTGRIIPSSVVAGNRTKRENSSRRDDDSETKSSRPKNSSTVSLPNYSELEITNASVQGDDEEDLKIHKITAAGSLPALITSGAIETIVKSDNDKRTEKTVTPTERVNDDVIVRSIDEVDFTFDVSKNLDTLSNIYKLEGPRVTSTPVKNGFDNDTRSPTTGGGWFLHQDRDSQSGECDYCPREMTRDKYEADSTKFFDTTKNSRSDTFFEAEEDRLEESIDNRARVERGVELVSDKPRRGTSLKRTLSNESEPFDSYEEKELRDSAFIGVRSNSPVKLVGRSISDESLPEEMLADQDDSLSLVAKPPIEATGLNDKTEKKLALEQSEKSDDTKTPPPSPEPKIKPELNDNDHSTLLKVLRDEAEESNLSSMTPSLTELEAALSDMLEREDDDQSSDEASKANEKIVSIDDTPTEKALEEPIEPKIVHNDIDKNSKHSAVSVSLKNILDGADDAKRKIELTEKSENDDAKMTEIDLANGDDYFVRRETRNSLADIAADATRSNALSALEPPEKPSRLHQVNLGESSEISEKIPTPPRRRNRSSVGANKDSLRGSIDRAATPENPYPNDRLI